MAVGRAEPAGDVRPQAAGVPRLQWRAEGDPDERAGNRDPRMVARARKVRRPLFRHPHDDAHTVRPRERRLPYADRASPRRRRGVPRDRRRNLACEEEGLFRRSPALRELIIFTYSKMIYINPHIFNNKFNNLILIFLNNIYYLILIK